MRNLGDRDSHSLEQLARSIERDCREWVQWEQRKDGWLEEHASNKANDRSAERPAA